MSAVFDLLRLSTVSLDVAAAHRGTAQGIAQRQQRRLAQLLDVALRESRLYQELLPRAAAPARRCSNCPWSRAASSWSALTTG